MSTSGTADCACSMAGSDNLKERTWIGLPNWSRFDHRSTQAKTDFAHRVTFQGLRPTP
jgi:hypothetical protein